MIEINSKWRNGYIQIAAGTGKAGYSKDGTKADLAELNGPAGLAVDQEDNVYIAEIFNHRISKINSKSGIITTVAGNGVEGFEGDGGPAIQAKLNGPEGVFVDERGNIYIADTFNQRIRMVDAETGIISTIAGTGEEGYNGDDRNACTALLHNPSGVIADKKGNVYFNDYKNDRVRRISPDGLISTYAGTGVCGYSGDGDAANLARINDVYGLGIDKNDNIYIMDSLNFAVRAVNGITGKISTVVGKGVPGPINEFEDIRESYIGGLAHEKGNVGMEAPHAVEVALNGNIFIGDTGSNRIRMADMEHKVVYTIAGNGDQGSILNNRKALESNINVHGLRLDSKDNLYFVDFYNHIVYVIKFSPTDIS